MNLLHIIAIIGSLPMRERELKLQGTVEKWRAGRVAPHAGARIETFCTGTFDMSAPSLPMRERELKLGGGRTAPGVEESLPMRERELKHPVKTLEFTFRGVAPHAGARIETARCKACCLAIYRRSPCGSSN